jgi:hypothetical protein
MSKQKSRLIREAKQAPCTDCGVNYPPYVMEFDHLPEHVKHFTIAGGTAGHITLDALVAELAKCEVVCRNCHAERTHSRATAVRRATPKLAIVPHQSVIQNHFAEMRRIEALGDAS